MKKASEGRGSITGRMSGWKSTKVLRSFLKLMTEEDIKNLTEHEKQWYVRSRNEINAAYLKTPEAQSQALSYTDRLLQIFEENLKQIQQSMIEESNADENESNRTGE